MVKSKFLQYVNTLIRIRIMEIRDGCNECRAGRALCREHWRHVADIVLHPRRHIDELRGVKKN